MKKFIKSLKKNERGLTLVELLAVVVILGIVGSIAFVAIGNVIDNSKADAHVANAQQLISAAKLYEASTGEFPEGGFDSSDGDHDTIGDLTDPWDADADYSGIVEKDEEGYKVTITGGESSCSLSSVPESIINQGREVACGYQGN